jgi:hypothetical protein
MWNLSFDKVFIREGVGAGVWISPPKVGTNLYSYKLIFDCTNNMAKYEALILGLRTLKELGAKRIAMHGDYELIINQLNGIYHSRHPRLRTYRNLVLDLLESDLSLIPRGGNEIADALDTSALVFKIPIFSNKKYDIEVKHRPAVPDNIKYWQLFEDDKQVERFLQMSDEFPNVNIDDECCCEEDEDIASCSNDDSFQNQIVGTNIVQLKNNIIPKGLVPVEKMFDENDVARNPRITVNDEDIED